MDRFTALAIIDDGECVAGAHCTHLKVEYSAKAVLPSCAVRSTLSTTGCWLSLVISLGSEQHSYSGGVCEDDLT